MKYRTGFVTNSSSSSSVIVTLKLKKKEHNIKFSFGEPGYWHFEPLLGLNSKNISYHNLVLYLINARLTELYYEVFENKNPNRNLTNVLDISSDGGFIIEQNLLVILNTEQKSKYYSQYLGIRDLYNAKNELCNNYDDFIKHPIWDLIGNKDIKPSELMYLKEENNFEYEDGQERYRTIIDLKSLRLEQKSTGFDYSDESDDEDYEYDEEFENFDYSSLEKISKPKKETVKKDEKNKTDEDDFDSIFFF